MTKNEQKGTISALLCEEMNMFIKKLLELKYESSKLSEADAAFVGQLSACYDAGTYKSTEGQRKEIDRIYQELKDPLAGIRDVKPSKKSQKKINEEFKKGSGTVNHPRTGLILDK